MEALLTKLAVFLMKLILVKGVKETNFMAGFFHANLLRRGKGWGSAETYFLSVCHSIRMTFATPEGLEIR